MLVPSGVFGAVMLSNVGGSQGMFFQDGLTGSAWGDWANYTDSPLRAFENELGVQARDVQKHEDALMTHDG